MSVVGWMRGGGGGGAPHSLSAFSELSSNSFKEAERINGGIIKQSCFELNRRGRSFVSDLVLSSAKVQQLRSARPSGDQEGSYCNPHPSAARVASPHIHTRVPSQSCACGESRPPRWYFFVRQGLHLINWQNVSSCESEGLTSGHVTAAIKLLQHHHYCLSKWHLCFINWWFSVERLFQRAPTVSSPCDCGFGWTALPCPLHH